MLGTPTRATAELDVKPRGDLSTVALAEVEVPQAGRRWKLYAPSHPTRASPLSAPVQQTASLSGVGAVVGRSLFLKNCPQRQISAGRHRHAYCIPSQPEMNCNQVIRPEIEPIVNGGHGGHPGLVKIRRKLGLTFVLSNPFQVPVAQSPAPPASSEADPARKAKPGSI